MTPAQSIARLRELSHILRNLLAPKEIVRDLVDLAAALETAMREPVAYIVEEADAESRRLSLMLSWKPAWSSDRPGAHTTNFPLFGLPSDADASCPRVVTSDEGTSQWKIQAETWEEEARRRQEVVDAATHIHMWNDRFDGGMVVSGPHVRKLWAALNRLDAPKEGKP